MHTTPIDLFSALPERLVDGNIDEPSVRGILRDILPHLPTDRIEYWADWIETRAAAMDFHASEADAVEAWIEDQSYAVEAA